MHSHKCPEIRVRTCIAVSCIILYYLVLSCTILYCTQSQYLNDLSNAKWPWCQGQSSFHKKTNAPCIRCCSKRHSKNKHTGFTPYLGLKCSQYSFPSLTQAAQAFSSDPAGNCAQATILLQFSMKTAGAFQATTLDFFMRARTAQGTIVFPSSPVRTAIALPTIHFGPAMRAALAFSAISFDFAMRTRFAFCTPGPGEFSVWAASTFGTVPLDLAMRTAAAFNTLPFGFPMWARLTNSTPVPLRSTVLTAHSWPHSLFCFGIPDLISTSHSSLELTPMPPATDCTLCWSKLLKFHEQMF